MNKTEMSGAGAGALSGQVAFVTGSGRGLGRAIASALVRMGADIVLHDISETAPAQYGEFPNLTAAVQSLIGNNVRGIGVTGDISDESAVRAMVDKIQASLGPVSILVNCAGGDIGARGTKPNPNGATDFLLEDLQAIINRNLIGTMLMSRAVAPGMAERRKGCIINIASIAAHFGSSPEVAYACAKAGVVHYTRCLAFEMRSAGVRVNCISPGPAKTARFLATRETDPVMMEEGPSLKRYATAEEIADAVTLLAGNQARFVSGQVLRVDGGAGLYPA